jgi:hypothetical protein
MRFDDLLDWSALAVCQAVALPIPHNDEQL